MIANFVPKSSQARKGQTLCDGRTSMSEPTMSIEAT